MYAVSSTLSHLIIWEPWPAVDHTAKKILMLGLVILWRKIKKIVPTNYVYFPLDTSENLIYMTTKKDPSNANVRSRFMAIPFAVRDFNVYLIVFAKFMQSKHFL